MFEKSTSLLVVAAAVTLTACASGPKLRSDYDHDADFSRYRTYNFMTHNGEREYQSLFHKYMVEAITVEMEKRGYVRSDDPDLLVNFNAVLQDKTQVRTTAAPPPMYGYYGYRTGYYGAWGAYPYATDTYVSQYTEGTFNIDLVDARRKQLVWEAVGIGRVSESVRENMEQRVREGVPKFFDLYPFVAGEGAPKPGA